ncbi:MAG: cupin domain-containing protein [Microcoleaceae cyanobacterium]
MNEDRVQLGLEKLKQEWEPKGFKCEIYSSEPGTSFSTPGHKTNEFFILIEGELELSFQDKTYNLAIGEQFEVPARIHHGFKNPGKTVNRMYWVYGYKWKWNHDGSGFEE